MILEPFGDLPLIMFRKALDGLFDFDHSIHGPNIRSSGRFVLLVFEHASQTLDHIMSLVFRDATRCESPA